MSLVYFWFRNLRKSKQILPIYFIIIHEIIVKKYKTNENLLMISDSPEKSSWSESPDTSDNPKVIPANIELRSLSTLPVCKSYLCNM